jgi:hypothetical protein
LAVEKTRPLTKLTAKQVEALISLSLWDWPGNCMGVARQLASKIGGEVCYGNWTGPIADTFPMNGRRMRSVFAGRTITHHAWIELNDAVIDPTRWVFEGVKAYIYYGENDHYDFGGNELRDQLLPPPPACGESAREDWRYPDFGNAIDRVSELLRCEITLEDGCSYEQLMWLANVSPKRIGLFYVREIYEALIAVDMEVAIPIDSRNRYAHE